jgi:hypothetical protein
MSPTRSGYRELGLKLVSLEENSAFTRTFFVSGPKSCITLQSRIGTFVHPQDTLLISRQLSREIGFRDIAKPCVHVLVLLKTPNPDGSTVNASILIGDFPIGKSAPVMSRFTRPQIPEPRTPMARALSPRHVTSLSAPISGIAGSRFHRSQFLCIRKPRMPNPDFPGSRATCPLVINGSDYIGKSLIAISTSMKLLPPQTRYAESRWPLVLLPAPKG